jgi:hypothetical protein
VTAVICPWCAEKIDLESSVGAATMLGATGQFPYGKANASDEGELRAAIATDHANGLIRLEFGKSLSWVALPAVQARALAEQLLARADELDRRKA